MSGKSKSVWELMKDTGSEFMEDKVLRLSAAMAYYAVFSIGPLLVLIIGVAGLALGEQHVHQEVGNQLKALFGEKSANILDSMMSARRQHGSLMATIIGGVALVFGASGVFGQLQDALNTIWEVKAKPGGGVWGFLRQRFLSMTMVLGLGFLLLISMVLTTLVDAFAHYAGNVIAIPPAVVRALNFGLSFVVVTVLFALIFKVLPDVKIRWRDVWVGAVGTAMLFTLGKFVLGWYLRQPSNLSAYGAGSAFVLIIMYIYYSTLILFFGAEFTQVYAKRHGEAIEPSKYAVSVTGEERANEGIPREAGHRGSRSHPAPLPQPAYAMKSMNQTREISRSPVQTVRSRPGALIVAGLGAGFAAGILLRFKSARKLLRLYSLARKTF